MYITYFLYFLILLMLFFVITQQKNIFSKEVEKFDLNSSINSNIVNINNIIENMNNIIDKPEGANPTRPSGLIPLKNLQSIYID